jgi:two-component system, OmpR family, sensor histidine kinase CpxA
MNRRLFWKIFLPFWVAQALLLGVLYMRLHYRLHVENPWWVQPEKRLVPNLADLAVRRYEESGQPALRTLLDQSSIPRRANYWLLDSGGHELSGRPFPELMLDLAQRASRREGMVRPDESVVIVAPVTTPRSNYLLVAEIIPPPLSERVPGDIVWVLKLGTIISALMCLVIAHYLSKPIERLRKATNELARGNLDIRVGATIGNRSDEIADLVRDFDSMAGELRNQIQSERNLLSGVSHELRSPIARMRLALALARGADRPEREEMLDRIEQDTIQLDSMLERILTVARLENGQYKPKFESHSLNDVVDDVLDDARFEAAATDATVNYRDDAMVQVSGDPGLLRSAIENVVRNAIFYSGRGGTIDVRLRVEDAQAILTISDNGKGVPEEALPLLFKPFYRVDDARGTTTGGMGLGLAIVRNAVAVHGGSVSARNVSPHGLEVELRLPIAGAALPARNSGVQLIAPLQGRR